MSVPVTDLTERYGTPSASRRALVVAVVVLVVAAGLAWLAWAMFFHTRPDVTSQLVGYHVRGEHAVTATFTVVRRDADVPATCRLRAVATDHAVVGQVSVPVPPGSSTSRVRATVRTEREATTLDLVGCTGASR